ncbi:MAG: hypothetical protein V3T53_15415 [Phycisphaerales bacterium]
MNIDEHRLTWVLIGAIGLCCGTAHAGGPPEYEVTAIIEGFQCGDHLAGVAPNAVNEAGDVAGYVICAFVQRAFRWTADTGLELIPMPPQTNESRALAINGSKVVGYHVVSGNGFGHIGFLYDFETDEFTSLGTLPGGNWSDARGINSACEIVGFWGDIVKGPFPQAFIWRDGEMIDIHPDFGTVKSRALGINADGLVTGWMGDSQFNDARAFIWDNGKVTELPPIPGGFTSEGIAVNNLTDIAGRGLLIDPRTDDLVARALVRIDGEMVDLGTLPGFPNSFAIGINDNQTVIGFAQSTFADAFVWKDGELAALDDLIPSGLGLDLSTARGINQAGQIAATAHSDDLNATVGLLLSPIGQGIPGDLDGDGHVGASDLLILLVSWGPCDDCNNCPADLDNNCVVGASDLLILLSNWG